MSEKETVYSSKLKFSGVFNFKDVYKFCFSWLTDEIELDVQEEEYSEKINGSVKDIAFKWVGEKDVTDYFRFQIKVESLTIAMSDVEINQGGRKIKSNKGDFEIKVKGVLIRDYDGKFETSGKMKLWRSIYEKWIIPSRVQEFEDDLAKKSDEFLAETKAFLDINAKR
jgi:hypothetical protein